LDYEERVREAGIEIPVIPGVMPIQAHGTFERMTKLTQTFVPPEVLAHLEIIKANDSAVKEYGVAQMTEICK
jgi:methylenetetrahydrofolate reductase (NADPH)